MENRDRFVIEVFLGLILIVFLFLLVFFVIGISNNSSTAGSNPTVLLPAVTKNYNSNNYNTYSPERVLGTTEIHRVSDRSYYNDYYDENRARVYYRDYYFYDDNYRYNGNDACQYENRERYLEYNSFSQLEKDEGVFGNDINNYEVYVRNEDFVGGYFEVTFYFEDYSGKTSKNSEVYYVPAREETKFFYRDVAPTRYKYSSWSYDVKSLTEVSI